MKEKDTEYVFVIEKSFYDISKDADNPEQAREHDIGLISIIEHQYFFFGGPSCNLLCQPHAARNGNSEINI